MASPVAIVITDTNGKALTVTGATSGSQFAAPIPSVLTDVNGNALILSGGSGSGTVNSGTAHQIAIYAASGTAVSGDTLLTDNGTTLAYTGTGGIASSGTVSIPATNYFQLDNAASFWRLVQTATGSGGNFRISQDGIIDAITVLNNTGYVGINNTNPSSPLTVTGAIAATGTLTLGAATPTTTTGQLGLGTTTGFGNGSPSTAVTTTTKNTGTGPTTPQTIVKYLEIDLAGTKYWMPLVQ